MAQYNWGLDQSYTAAVDLSASQYYFVIAGSVAGEVTISATAAASCLGVLQNDPRAAEEATVRVFGFSKVRANTESAASPLVWGQYVKSGSDGMCTGALNPSACTCWMGRAEESLASGSGVYVRIFVSPRQMAD